MVSDSELADRRALATRVDPGDLSRAEQETWITFAADEDRFQFGSYFPPIVRSVLEHDHAEIEWVYARPGDGRRWLERDIGADRLYEAGCRIEGVQATLPVGALTIKGSPRSRDIPSQIVNTPADVEAAREAFASDDDPEPDGEGEQ